jgi:hypothetical protein
MSRKKNTIHDSDNQTNCSPSKLAEIKNCIQYFMARYDYFILFFILLLAYNTAANVGLQSGDVAPASILPIYLIIHQNLYFDTAIQFLSNPSYDYAFPLVNGHNVSLFPIVTPILVTPVYVVSYILCVIFGISMGFKEFLILAKTSSSIIAALAGVLFYMTGKELFSKNTALITTFIFAFATSTWSISSQALWQHGTVELLLISMVYLIVRNEKAEWRGNIFLLGILSGLFIFNRPPDSILLIPVLFYILWSQRKTVHYYILGGIMSGLPFLYYNYSIFGNFFGGYTENLPLFALNLKFIGNYLGLLIAPNTGLLIFCPVLILSIVGYISLWKTQKSKIDRILLLFGPVIALQILLYSFFERWSSTSAYCFGPRFLTGFIPVLCLFIGFFLTVYFDRTQNNQTLLKTWGIPFIICILVLSSVIIQFIGVFFYDFYPKQTMSDSRAWDWNDSIIVGSYVSGTKNIVGIFVYTLPPLPPLFEYSFQRES